MLQICPECGGRIEYLEEIHFLINPPSGKQETGIVGDCTNCDTTVYTKFVEYETEVSVDCGLKKYIV